MPDLMFAALLALPVLYGLAVWLKHQHEKREEQGRNARIREIREENLELDRQMAETEANAVRRQAHLEQRKTYVPIVLPPKEPHKPEPPLTDAEAQALDLVKHRASYQETVWDRELREQAQAHVVPTRVIDRQSKLIRTYTPTPPTRTYESSPDTSLSLLTAVAVSGIFDSDTSSPSPDPTPSWSSSDDSSGSGFGGGGSSGEW